jgi:uncharacterized RDD family membrane protein YckC
MSNAVLFSFSLLSAITMALIYRPMLEKLSVGLISPYAKADIAKRALATTVDVMLVVLALFSYNRFESLRYLILATAYVLLKDAIGGRSAGKFLFGLFVVDLETGRPSGYDACMRRNVFFVLPGANVVAAFLEARTLVRDPQGQRLGDRFALTQVVEGYGAKDLVSDVYQWLLDILEEFDGQIGGRVRKTGRVPVKVQHRVEIQITEPPPNGTTSQHTIEDEEDFVLRR